MKMTYKAQCACGIAFTAEVDSMALPNVPFEIEARQRQNIFLKLVQHIEEFCPLRMISPINLQTDAKQAQ